MSNKKDLLVPDIGDFTDVEVIEILVSPGDTINAEDSLLTLETDKATMEIPASEGGVVVELKVKLGDKISQGTPILVLEAGGEQATPPTADTDDSTAPHATPDPAPNPVPGPLAVDNTLASNTDTPAAASVDTPPPPPPPSSPTAHLGEEHSRKAHASPAVRRFARELGVDIGLVSGTGRKSRIQKSDVKEFVKSALASSGTAYGAGARSGAVQGNMGIPPIPEIDFSKFGPVERVEMSRIGKLSAANLHRAWLNVPHVTHHDEADITDLEAFRKSLKGEAEKRGIRVTGLVFHMKALAHTLASYPKFNSSLAADGESLIYKKYCHIGIAVDTPNGLVVPVFKDVDQKSIYTLSEELMDISERARKKKLKPDEMQGACMTISSLGGIGGTAFTPIVNAPEAAILGITRAKMQPVWNGSEFVPRLMCPLDISYDHRVIDGADAARFMAHYCNAIADVRRLLL